MKDLNNSKVIDDKGIDDSKYLDDPSDLIYSKDHHESKYLNDLKDLDCPNDLGDSKDLDDLKDIGDLNDSKGPTIEMIWMISKVSIIQRISNIQMICIDSKDVNN